MRSISASLGTVLALLGAIGTITLTTAVTLPFAGRLQSSSPACIADQCVSPFAFRVAVIVALLTFVIGVTMIALRKANPRTK